MKSVWSFEGLAPRTREEPAPGWLGWDAKGTRGAAKVNWGPAEAIRDAYATGTVGRDSALTTKVRL